MTETNTPEMEGRICRAARSHKPKLARNLLDLQTDFEHGQWWITNRATGAQWAVCDTDTGFDFEMVTCGDDE